MRRLRSHIAFSLVLLFSLCCSATLAPCADNISSLTRKLQRALVDLPGYTIFDFVSFRITDDHVVLLGDVLRPELKQAAEQAVRTAIGKNTVVDNRIEILPASVQGAAIRRKLYDRLYASDNLCVTSRSPNREKAI